MSLHFKEGGRTYLTIFFQELSFLKINWGEMVKGWVFFTLWRNSMILEYIILFYYYCNWRIQRSRKYITCGLPEQRFSKKTNAPLEQALQSPISFKDTWDEFQGKGERWYDFSNSDGRSYGNSNYPNGRGQGNVKMSRDIEWGPTTIQIYKEIMVPHIQCFNCKKNGLISVKCKFNDTNESSQNANIIKNNPNLLLACKKVDNIDRNLWCLFRRVSNHMCHNKELFVVLDESIMGNKYEEHYFGQLPKKR